MSPSIGIIFITHNAKHHLPYCLPPIISSSLKPRVLVVNSSSNDGTVELAERMGAETLVIPRNEFNHGLTREKARKYLNTDIVVMMTPDAYATDSEMISMLVSPIIQGKASFSYARQIPHKGAGFFERFPREFNYPKLSVLQIRSIDDSHIYGAKLFFCSDSCAAYLNKALDDIGGFSETLIAEDYIAAIKLLSSGFKIAYVSDAVVMHSHRYSLKDEFKRLFDTGYIRGKDKDIEKLTGRTEKSGSKYFKSFIKESFQTNFFYVPYSILVCITKYLGFRVGYIAVNWPVFLKKALSSSDFYWISKPQN